jgi:hypothetical protein
VDDRVFPAIHSVPSQKIGCCSLCSCGPKRETGRNQKHDHADTLDCFIAFNVAGIGLSEIQRRFLAEHSRDLLLELRKVEQQKLVDEAEALNRQSKLLGEIAARLNNVEISIEKKAGQPR